MNLFEKTLNVNAKEEIMNELNKLSLNEEEQSRLSEELNHLNEINSCIIYLLKIIKDYANEKKEYIFYRGYIYNSFICYLLKITDINPFDKKYYLYNEFLYRDGIIDADINVSWQFEDKLVKYLKVLLKGNFYKALIEEHDKLIKHPTKYVVFLDDSDAEFINYNGEQVINYNKLYPYDFFQIDICNVTGLNQLSEDINEYGYPKIDLFNNKEIFNSIFKVDNMDNSILYKFINEHVLKDRKEKLLIEGKYYNLLDYYLTAYGKDITNEDEIFDIYCKLFPKTRDQLMKLLLEYGVERRKAYKLTLMISTGKNKDYKRWKKTINEIYDILEIETRAYLELTNYLPPLGHVIAYVRYDALRYYFELIKEEQA